MIIPRKGSYTLRWPLSIASFHRKQSFLANVMNTKRQLAIKNFVKTPIHYQEPGELLKTIVKGGNYRLENRNFWQRCSSAVLYHKESFSGKDLIVIANAFAKARYHDPTLFKAIAELSLLPESKWKTEEIPILLNAFKTCDYFDKQLFQKAISDILHNISHISPTGLSLTLNSLTVTDKFVPEEEFMNRLLEPLFTNISQFSLENISLIVRALAHLDYRNEALLRLVSHHAAAAQDHSQWSYLLTKAMVKLDYVDDNVVEILIRYLRGNLQFMHVDGITELLKLLISMHSYRPIDETVYENIIRVLYRNQGRENWRIIFGVHGELRKISQRNTYLDEICLHIKEDIRANLSTQEKIDLLSSCEKFPLTLVGLYDALLDTLEGKIDDTTEIYALSCRHRVSDKEHLNLMLTFSRLGYLRGVLSCLKSLSHNCRDIQGAAAMKYNELLTSLISFEELLNFRQKYLEEPLHTDTLVQKQLCASGNSTKDDSTGLGLHKPFFESTSDVDRTIIAWRYIEEKTQNASPNEFALGICHADTLYFLCKLAPLLLRGPAIDAELIPAVLRRSVVLTSRENQKPQVIRELHGHLLKQLLDNNSIPELSTLSFLTLTELMDHVHSNESRKVLQELKRNYIERMYHCNEKLITQRLLCNRSLGFVTTCMNKKEDAMKLAECICSNAHYLDLGRIHNLLELLVQMGYADQAYISMLQPTIDKAITMDSDMCRIGEIEAC